MHVLLVDDDPEFSHYAKLALAAGSVDCALAESAQEGLALLEEKGSEFDVVLLDVHMPPKSGWDVLLEIREKGNEIPVLFVSAYDEVSNRVRGLRMGADDYICKPIEPAELLARLDAVVRRRQALPTRTFGDLTLDLAYRKFSRGGEFVSLSPREYDVLLKLVEAEGELVTREELLLDLWGIDHDPQTNLVEAQVGRLRRKLAGRNMIETVRGRGYRLIKT